MNETTKRRRRGLWWKIPLNLLLLLVVILAVVWLRLSAIATGLANRKLPGLLGTEASVERIELRPAQGLAAIHGLRIGQPDGFGEGPLLEAGRVRARIDLGSLKSEEGMLLETVEIDGFTANITKNPDGILNLLSMGSPPVGDDGESPETGTDVVEEDVASGSTDPAASFPGLRIGQVAITDVALNYRDESTGEKPIEIALGNLEVQLTDGHVDLGEIPAVRLGEGTVTLEDIRIAQPEGFGDEELLVFPRLHLEMGTDLFVDNVVRLQRLEAEGLRAVISRDTHGVMNVARLGGGPPPPPPVEPEAEPAEGAVETVEDSEVAPEAEPGEGTAPQGPPVGIHLVELALTDFGVTYRDAALGGKQPLHLAVRNLALSVTDLMVFLSEPAAASTPVSLEVAIVQGEHPDALLSLFATIGPVGGGIPDINAQTKLSGFMLDTLGTLVPATAREAVGASGADLQAVLVLTESTIDLSGDVQTDAGHGYPVGVKGPLDGPKVDLGPIAMAVVGRLTGGVANLATGAAGAALDVTKGMTGGATDVAKGATGASQKLGGGLFKSAKAALTLDAGKVGEGLKQATVGVVTEAGKSVQDAGGSVIAETREGVGGITGNKATKAWLANIATRHATDVEAARQALAEMPFPPETNVPVE